MDRVTGTVAVSLLALLLVAGGCGEPLIVLGDAPGLMRVVLGVPDSAGSRVDTLAARTRLTEPSAVAYDADGAMLYVADRGAVRQSNGITTRVARIFSVDSRGRARLLLDAGGCSAGPCILEVAALARAADGSLIIADATGQRVLRYVPGGAITILAGTGTAAGSPDGSSAAQSPVDRPAGIALAADGTVLFSEAGAHRVRAITPDGRLRTVAGSGSAVRGGDGGAATAAGVPQPAGLLFVDDVLYVAEHGGASVRAVHAAGTIATVAGVGTAGFSGDGGPATIAHLDRPIALAASGDGRTLFVSDQGNHRVRALSLTSGLIRTFAGTGGTLLTGSRLAAGATSLSSPAGLAAGGGFLFVVDRGHAVVWRTTITIN